MRWKLIYDFVYYRLSQLVTRCFSSVTRLNINPYQGKMARGKSTYHILFKKRGDVRFTIGLTEMRFSEEKELSWIYLCKRRITC